MIDLHSHILPGIDDGARDLEVALQMARLAAASGVKVMACTPHITPGVWNNSGPDIREAVVALQSAIDLAGIALRLVSGADVHIAPDLIEGLRSGRILSLHDTRYVLIETPHHIAPPNLDTLCFSMLAAGYVPILTHPERLTWISKHYERIGQLFRAGVLMQITAGSITGEFGKNPLYWGERMLEDGLVHILATDAHGDQRRRPDLAAGRRAAAAIVGEEEANNLVMTRPYGILRNLSPDAMPQIAVSASNFGEENVNRYNAQTVRFAAKIGIGKPGNHDIAIFSRVRRFFQRDV